MVSKLDKGLASLRAIAPSINAAADEANKVVKMVEGVLVNELRIGVSATSSQLLEYRRRATDENGNVTEEETGEYLAFGRVSGVYCLHLAKDTYEKDEYGCFNQEVDSEKIPWSSCDRETRLSLFEQLPSLIENIVEKAKRIAEQASNTAAKVKELIADDDKTEQAATEEPTAKVTLVDPNKAVPAYVGARPKDVRQRGLVVETVEPAKEARRSANK